MKRTVTRKSADWYPTPAPMTRALLSLAPPPSGRVWEPACGDGAMAREIAAKGYDVLATDLFNRGYGEARRDFLLEQELHGCDSIITNPPFNLADAFVSHALRLSTQARWRFVAMLLPLTFLGGLGRGRDIFARWGGPELLVSSRRISLWPGGVEPEAGGTSTITYAWFVWRDGCAADGEIKFFDWQDFA